MKRRIDENAKVTLTLKQLKNLVKEARTLTEDESLPDDKVNEFEERLRAAQDAIEGAARIVCSSHNQAAIDAYNRCARMAREVSDIIGLAYRFRKW